VQPFVFAIRGIFDGINVFVLRRARSAEEIAERILFPPPPEHPNCRCTILEPKKEGEK
jgi:hypothetical protein